MCVTSPGQTCRWTWNGSLFTGPTAAQRASVRSCPLWLVGERFWMGRKGVKRTSCPVCQGRTGETEVSLRNLSGSLLLAEGAPQSRRAGFPSTEDGFRCRGL